MSKSWTWRFGLASVIAIVGVLLVVTVTVLAANTIVWQPASTGLPASGLNRDVAFGDVNNDGKPDMIVAGGNGIGVYIGDGAGNWNGAGFSTGLPVAGQYWHVIVADFNRDGKLDIAASQGSTGPVGAWVGDGAGNWTAWTGLPTGTYEGIAAADVNKDGRPDLIVAGGAPVYQGIRVFLSTGASFSETTPITTTGTYYDVAADYVDNDGSVDVVAAGQGATGGLRFWHGNYGGSWIYSSTGLTTTNTFRGVTFGDVDLDGKPELIASRFGFPTATGGGIFIYKYDATSNTWSLAPNQIPLTNSYYKLELGDLNNDGRLDLVAGGGSTTGSPGLFTYLGSQTGFISVTPPITSGSLDRMTIGDFDRNGLPDIGAADNGGAGVFAWSDQGVRDSVGAWHPIASPQITGVVNALGFGDFNRDGNLDVVMSRDTNAGLIAWLGDGGNSWTTCPITQLVTAQTGTWNDLVVGPFYPYTVEPDVIAASGSGGGIQHFGQAGTGCGYWYNLAITSTGSFRGLSVGDIDRNGYDEIVAASSTTADGLHLWLGTVNGWSASPVNPTSTGNYYDTALGDFNNDGWLDIAAASDVNGIRVIKSNASIRSFTTYTVTANGAYQAIAVGDLNNDGKLDIVAGANGGANNGVDVWMGDGAFNFTPATSPDTTGQYFDLSLADVNHDGLLDILAGGENIGPKVWLNNGVGGWTLSTTALPTTGTYLRSQFGHIDHDGNVDILATTPGNGLQMWTAAEATPPTINNFQPSGWITTTQSPTITANALDTGSGLNVTSGQYRFSTDGGGTWSSLSAASISGSSGTTSTQNITALNVPFNQDSATQNKIEFRAMDVVGNLGIAQGTIKIDTVPPTAPTSISSSDHTVNVWSNDNTISINWSGATDATSGVYAYAVLFDQNATTLPSPTVNGFAGSFTSGALADGATWYAHVRTVDVAGNWSTTAAHLGPFKIDTVPPTNPTSVSSSSHSLGVWSGDPSITMIWSGASDPGGSGVSGYSFVFDTSSSTLPDTTVDTFSNNTTSASLPSGSNKYFHIRTRDLAGNWSTTAVDRGAYWVDVTAPSSSTSSPSSVGSTSFTVSWSGTDFGQSGIANYDIQYRDATTSGAWTTWKSATTSTSSTFFGSSGHIYQFRSRARDNVGNLETYPGSYDSQTGVATIDLEVKNPGIEVNQAVQDLNNSVILIANKRTFVRCYVDSNGGGTIGAVPARLYVYRGATYMGSLSPANSGAAISVKSSPDRSQLNDAYYFDVPTGWLSLGSVTFQCQVNTPTKYADSNSGNNLRSTTVFFIKSPTMNVLMVDADYKYGGIVRHVRSVDRTRLEAWLRAAYPINSLNVYYGYMDPPYNGLPNVDTLNDDLAWNQSKKVLGAGENPWTRYYGQVIQVDSNTFMRGKARGIPDTVASGPTGPTSGWDPDGTFGDWYGGHEIGHTFGRYHAEFCGAQDGASYPYPGGRISPTTGQWTNTTLYGIDWSLPTPLVIPPTWTDVMTYCNNEWISDFTYEGIWGRMFLEQPVAKAQIDAYKAQGVEYLALFGQIITSTNTVTLSTFYRVPDAFDVFGRDITGTYHIKLLGAGDAALADYNFSPRGSPETDDPVQAINEYVPWITGTQKIVIASATQDLVTRTVSTHIPTITLDAPTGGITLTGSTVDASWTASDADNDPLTFSIDYSRDGGVTWSPLSGQITETAATLNLDLLPGSDAGKFRVWVSDGVNTAFAETTGTFSVANKAPQITSVSPISGSTYVVSQTITFEATTFDPEDGPLPDDHLQWSSDLDGPLGTGTQLPLDTLSVGTHTITLSATDNQGAITTTTLVIHVEPESTEGSVAPDVFLPVIMK